MEPDPVAIGAKMRESREKRGLSMREVARRMGYSAAFVSDLELGRRTWSQVAFQKYGEALK